MFSNFPKEIHLKDGRKVTIQPMEKTDGDQLLEYFQSFRPEDRLFMRDNVTDPKVIQKWVEDLDYEYVVPLLAFHEGKIVGISSLHRNQHGWDSHVGHIRVSVRPEFQGSRLGYNLSREIFVVAQSMHIDIVIAEMPSIQNGAIKIFEKLGFNKEHVFENHVKDHEGNIHDLVVMRADIVLIMDNMLQAIRDWEDKGG
ncbi:MAG: GNAT family N-acetyltransferase [FCB group bacterium]|nr:GNAT family N-acetyltransferase [FCB group bacterium]